MNQEDLLPVNRNYFLIGGCITLIFTISIGAIAYNYIYQKNIQDQLNQITTTPATNLGSSDISKYNQDSDQDKIPNFIENENNLNQYIAETDYCQKKFPSCSESPIQKPTYVSLLLNASTSMNIPAKVKQLKYELVVEEVKRNLLSNQDKKFLKIGIVSFGNKGNLNNLAENESCVSNLTLKKFTTNLTGSGDIQVVENMFKSYVPNGKSPLVYTLTLVEKGFPDPKANNVVEIITDGVDDCNGDLQTTIEQIKQRGIIKRIDLISIFGNEDSNSKLKEAIESNSGKFSTSDKINETLNQNYNSFIYESWCKVKNYNNVYQCLTQNYNKASEALNSQLSTTTPRNEVDKIREIQSSINVVIEKFNNSNEKSLEEELIEFLKSK